MHLYRGRAKRKHGSTAHDSLLLNDTMPLDSIFCNPRVPPTVHKPKCSTPLKQLLHEVQDIYDLTSAAFGPSAKFSLSYEAKSEF